MYNPGDQIGPYEIIGAGPRGDAFVVECANCKTETIKTIQSLRYWKGKDQCPACDKQAESQPVYSPIQDIMILRDDLSELKDAIKKTGQALNRRIDLLAVSDVDERISECDKRAKALLSFLAEQKSKEIIFTEMFALLGMRFRSGSIAEKTYLDRVGFLMRMVESIPAAWWHARRERKMGEWLSVLTKAGVDAAIEEGLTVAEVENEFFE